MRSPQTVIERGQELFSEVCRSMCREPDKLRVQFHDDGTTIRVQLTAHPSDARSLVGYRGEHIKQLGNLARLLFWGSDRIVQILEIESFNEPYLPSFYFRPDPEWSDNYMIQDLLLRLAKAVFPKSQVEIESEPYSESAQNIALTLKPEPANKEALRHFAATLSVLFVPIGKLDGRIVYVTVNSKRQEQTQQRPDQVSGEIRKAT